MKITHEYITVNKDSFTGDLVINGLSLDLIENLTSFTPRFFMGLLQNSFEVLVKKNNAESHLNIIKLGIEVDEGMTEKVLGLRDDILNTEVVNVCNYNWLRIPVILNQKEFRMLTKEIVEQEPNKCSEINELKIMFNKIKEEMSKE